MFTVTGNPPWTSLLFSWNFWRHISTTRADPSTYLVSPMLTTMCLLHGWCCGPGVAGLVFLGITIIHARKGLYKETIVLSTALC